MSHIFDILNSGPKSKEVGNISGGDPVKPKYRDANDTRQFVGDGGFIDQHLKLFPPIPGKTAYEDIQAALGYLHLEEMEGLLKTVKGIPFANPVIVNIGAGAGTSVSIFMSRDDTTVISVDKECGDSPLGSLLSEEILLRKYGMYDTTRYSQICRPSIEAGKEYSGQKADVLFIDGDHSAEGCLGDFLAWFDHLNPGALIIFHDIASWCGVTKVVEDLTLDGIITELNMYDTLGVYSLSPSPSIKVINELRGVLDNGKYADYSGGRKSGTVGLTEPEATPEDQKSPRGRKPTRKAIKTVR